MFRPWPAVWGFRRRRFGWRKAFLNKQKEDVPPGVPVPLVEIVVGDVIIRVAPDLGEAALRRLIRAVRSA
jgi:transposase